MPLAPVGPVETLSLFRPLLAELLAVLRGLDGDQWSRVTVAPGWRVRDVAAHLLDGDLRKIAAYRDDHAIVPDHAIGSDADLGRFINALNASGVAWSARLSPRLVTDLLEITGGWVADVLAAVEPRAVSRFPVSWAGEGESQQWMDTGREYTERWHHQAQIRDAVGARLLLEPRWMDPFLDISARALPHAYAAVGAPDGTTVTLDVHGETDARWTLVRGRDRWELMRGAPDVPDAVVRVSTDAAWRLLYNALPDPAAHATLEGAEHYAAPMLRARSVIL
jgi:uncharacterized protein (TIGR03083 family)